MKVILVTLIVANLAMLVMAASILGELMLIYVNYEFLPFYEEQIYHCRFFQIQEYKARTQWTVTL